MARIRYDAQNYIYGSTRVRAVSARMMISDKIIRAAECRTLSEALRTLEEGGLRMVNGNLEQALALMLSETYRLLAEVSPASDIGMFHILRYPYDCHNIKSALKCSIRQTDPRALLYDEGSVSVPEIIRMARERDFSHGHMPPNMGKAAYAALESYYKHGDPQQIDTLLDIACYRDMVDCAAQFDFPYLADLIACRADTTNILTCIRIIRMNGAFGKASFAEMMLPGGILDEKMFFSVFERENAGEREAALISSVSYTRYAQIKIAAGDSLTHIARECEKYCLNFIRSASRTRLYGAEVLFDYVSSRENDIKNIRIAVAGRAAGLSAEIIRERLRI